MRQSCKHGRDDEKKRMDPAAASLADRFRSALDACDVSHSRADHTPVASELKTWSSFSPLQAVQFPPASAAPHIYSPEACAPSISRVPVVAAPPGAFFPSQPPLHGPPQQASSSLKIAWLILAALVLAALAIFLRRKVISWFQKTPPPSEEEDLYAEDTIHRLPQVFSRQEKLKKKPTAVQPSPVGLYSLLPKSLTRTAQLAKTDPPLRGKAHAKPAPAPRVPPPRRVSIQEPEREEEFVYQEDLSEDEVGPQEPDPNFLEI